jgi:hypothetical protein
MQLCHGFDKENFPFVISRDSDYAKVFLVNVNTQKRIPLINLKKVHKFDLIHDI